MQLTRPQRKRFFSVLIAAGWAALMAMFWLTTAESWQSQPEWRNRNSGVRTTMYGMLPVVEIIQRDVTPTGQRGPEYSTQWTWHPVRLITTLLASAFITLLAVLLYRRLVRTRKLAARYCDECGYDLTGVQSKVCPECGTAVTTAHALS